MIDLLVLSPHLDDGALSCGGRIAQAARRGERVAIVTAFAAPEPEEPLSELARMLHRGWGLPPGEVIATRRREDRDACRVLCAEPLHLELPEAPYRRHPRSGAALYATPEALFRTAAEGDEGAPVALERALRGMPPARRVAAPLGVGGHVDHRLVRAAAESCFDAALEYYEDFPYVAQTWRGLARALGRRRSWLSAVVALTQADVAARCEAIACFRSQLGPLFGTAARMERAVRRRVARVGGERTWRRRPPGGRR